MFIAHFPAGYLCYRASLARRPRLAHTPWAFAACAFGSIAPDLDLFYAKWFDNNLHDHHAYVTHYPLLWLVLWTLCWTWQRRRPNAQWPACAGLFAANCVLHMVLDSVAGGIRWLAPFSLQRFVLVEVPARHHPWWLNFFHHWTAGLELAICAAALIVWQGHRLRPTASRHAIISAEGKRSTAAGMALAPLERHNRPTPSKGRQSGGG